MGTTTKEALASFDKRRVMLAGPKGVGKSSVASKVAGDYARKGKKVLFEDLGTERGAGAELAKLPQSALDHITYVRPRTFRQVVQPLDTTKGYELVIVDALQNLRAISAEVAVKTIIATGADKDDRDKDEGKKSVIQRMIDIDGVGVPSLLPWGKGTDTQKQYEGTFFDRLFDLEANVLLCYNTKSLVGGGSYADIVAGYVDVFVTLQRYQTDERTFEHSFVVEKIRGVKNVDATPVKFGYCENILDKIDAIFAPKPPMLMTCGACNKTAPVSELQECAKAGHPLAKAAVESIPAPLPAPQASGASP